MWWKILIISGAAVCVGVGVALTVTGIGGPAGLCLITGGATTILVQGGNIFDNRRSNNQNTRSVNQIRQENYRSVQQLKIEESTIKNQVAAIAAAKARINELEQQEENAARSIDARLDLEVNSHFLARSLSFASRAATANINTEDDEILANSFSSQNNLLRRSSSDDFFGDNQDNFSDQENSGLNNYLRR